MKDNQKFEAKIAELSVSGIKTFTKEEILKDPDLLSLGENRGIPFSFIEGEILTMPEIMKYTVRTYTLRGETRKSLQFLALSNLRDVIEVPVSIFCRVPSLESERAQLFVEENALGKKLAEQMPDIRRADVLCAKKTVTVFKRVPLHQDSWYTDDAGIRHRVPDSEDLPNRRILWCYMFK